MKPQPLNDLVLLSPIQVQEMSAGGIILPETAQKRPDEGLVEAIAPGAIEGLAIGDRVIYKGFSANDINVDGTEYKLVSAGDLLAILVDSDEIPD